MESSIITTIRKKYKGIQSIFDERSRRLWAATEATGIGRGGISAVSLATGLCRRSIRLGLQELDAVSPLPSSMIRQPRGGRKKCTDKDKTLLKALDALVEPLTRGDPTRPLRWTCKSERTLAAELQAQGHQVGRETVGHLLKQMDYSLQSNRKTREGQNHPDRNSQFEYIHQQCKKFIRQKQPVLSVDTKKKENLGNFSNKGRSYRNKKNPVTTNTHDFPDPKLGKAIPYGVYDIANNLGFVNVGIDHDTAQFAVNSIRVYWQELGLARFPKATRLLITADCGDSNGYRTKLWKIELQKLADELGLEITVCHFPPGTSKWNKIEHKLFSFISKNWRAEPLKNMATIVNLISNTKTTTGLKVCCVVDEKKYERKIKVANKELENCRIKLHKFHPEWNYTIKPKNFL
ncbi:MAG: ISAzo13 family transposase [Planctomycetaceae bacterium]|nr:ISAzo13 family transposase [Planctomycetaceae bacterium]